MIDAGLALNKINARVGKIRRMRKWAVAEELVAPTVLLGLQTVGGLRPGRSRVRETAPVRPVTPEQVAAVLPFVFAPVRAMMQLQDLTGARPGEIMALQTGDVDRSEAIWIYAPGRHKTQDKGFSRGIPLGPKAQAILTPWFKDDPLALVFSPAEAVAIRNATAKRNRKSLMTPSQAAPESQAKASGRDEVLQAHVPSRDLPGLRQGFPPPGACRGPRKRIPSVRQMPRSDLDYPTCFMISIAF